MFREIHRSRVLGQYIGFEIVLKDSFIAIVSSKRSMRSKNIVKSKFIEKLLNCDHLTRLVLSS